VSPSPRVQRLLARIINVYPPFLGAGIRVRQSKAEPYTVISSMTLRPWNRNLFGTHFGGSLYAMCDPFFALILARHLGAGYVVWDRSASIEFLRPGRGIVRATFHIPPDEIAKIRERADEGEKVEPRLVAEVVGEDGEVVARVEKRLYVRRARTER
jgi:acyl-coenzyme A thioesterase PaaI-like protein